MLLSTSTTIFNLQLTRKSAVSRILILMYCINGIQTSRRRYWANNKKQFIQTHRARDKSPKAPATCTIALSAIYTESTHSDNYHAQNICDCSGLDNVTRELYFAWQLIYCTRNIAFSSFIDTADVTCCLTRKANTPIDWTGSSNAKSN